MNEWSDDILDQVIEENEEAQAQERAQNNTDLSVVNYDNQDISNQLDLQTEFIKKMKKLIFDLEIGEKDKNSSESLEIGRKNTENLSKTKSFCWLSYK